MTIGEKIKYFRKRRGITQATLAELSGIHPVSIRKYETNKMVPQAQQIDRIAEALEVSSFAIAGIENNILLETTGDFMSLIMMLCKTHIISIDGERQKNGSLAPETVCFRINPFITGFFDAASGTKAFTTDSIMYYLKSEQILQTMLKWETINHRYESLCEQLSTSDDKELRNILDGLRESKEAIELELQL